MDIDSSVNELYDSVFSEIINIPTGIGCDSNIIHGLSVIKTEVFLYGSIKESGITQSIFEQWRSSRNVVQYGNGKLPPFAALLQEKDSAP